MVIGLRSPATARPGRTSSSFRQSFRFALALPIALGFRRDDPTSASMRDARRLPLILQLVKKRAAYTLPPAEAVDRTISVGGS